MTTVVAILRTVGRKHGKARRVWIFDRGVVSEENLAAIRKRGGEYLKRLNPLLTPSVTNLG